jgi:outer membrane protein assembly factor BamB
MKLIRHLAISRDSSIVAAAEFEHKVHIWDINTGNKISEFMTVLDFGGTRLALSHDGLLCLAASYGRGGISCHSTKNGEILWHRNDLSKFQKLSMAADGKKMYCDIDSSHCLIIDLENGSIVDKIPKVRIIYENNDGSRQLLVGNNLVLKNIIENLSFLLERDKPSLLSSSFGDKILCISKSGGDVHFFNSNNGQEIWRYQPISGSHVLELGYFHENNCFYGIEWPYKKGGNESLLVFNINKNNVRQVFKFSSPQPEISFVPHLNKVITSKGLIFDLKSEVIEKELQFEK